MASADEIKQLATEFVALVTAEPVSSAEDPLGSLLDLLDRLSLFGRHVNYTFEDGPDPPRGRYKEFYRLAVDRFPGLSCYNIPDPISEKPADAKVLVGDPYDDIADISQDLEEVLWLFENASEGTALWQFEWGYQNHWGEHASNLRWYLFARERGH
jgi:hypothetical protein